MSNRRPYTEKPKKQEMKHILKTSFLFILLFMLSCKTIEQDNCIDQSKIRPDAMCTAQFDPVCGCDGRTYGNLCEAENAGVISYKKGACPE